MKTYVLGFAFKGDNVLLIKKNRPDWAAGKLNGIGGHVEPFEGGMLHLAMVREFVEETGIQSDPIQWDHIARITHPNKAVVEIFRSFNINIYKAVSTTDEPVECIDVETVYHMNTESIIPNLRYLLPVLHTAPRDMEEIFNFITPNPGDYL